MAGHLRTRGATSDQRLLAGGPRRSPREAVGALGEAIDIIRGMWDAGDPMPLRFDGDHYQVAGAQRGPLPAHDIPIWLGAYNPRMLQLVGRKADGWLPSLKFLQPGQLQAGNQIIDEAARAAGRNPREIRRLLNIAGRFSPTRGGFLDGPSEQWVEELLTTLANTLAAHGPLRQDLRRWLAKARKAGLDDESIEALFLTTFRTATSEEIA